MTALEVQSEEVMSAEEKVRRVKDVLAKLLLDKAFKETDKKKGEFYYLVSKKLSELEVEYAPIPDLIMGTDGKKLYVGPLYEKLEAKYMGKDREWKRLQVAIILHEVLHVLYAHPLRARLASDKELYNIVADLFVNNAVQEILGLEMPREFVTLGSFLDFIYEHFSKDLTDSQKQALNKLAELEVEGKLSVEQVYNTLLALGKDVVREIKKRYGRGKFFGHDLTDDGGRQLAPPQKRGEDTKEEKQKGQQGKIQKGEEEEEKDDKGSIKDYGDINHPINQGTREKPTKGRCKGKGQKAGGKSNSPRPRAESGKSGGQGKKGETGEKTGDKPSQGRKGREESKGGHGGQEKTGDNKKLGEKGGKGESEEKENAEAGRSKEDEKGKDEEKKKGKGSTGETGRRKELERIREIRGKIRDIRKELEKTLDDIYRAKGEYRAIRRERGYDDIRGRPNYSDYGPENRSWGTAPGVYGIEEFRQIARMILPLEILFLREVGDTLSDTRVTFTQFDEDAYWLPAIEEERRKRVLAFIDSSPSIGRLELLLFLSLVKETMEVYDIEYELSVFSVGEVDHKVINKDDFDPERFMVKRGGGTVFDKTIAERIREAIRKGIRLIQILSDFEIGIEDDVMQAFSEFKKYGGRVSCYSVTGLFQPFCDRKYELPKLPR